MKNLLKLSFAFTAITLLVSCGGEDDSDDDGMMPPIEGGIEVIIANNITSDQTWSNDSVYVLAGRIAIEEGATLTIEGGTVIKGQAGTGANATALLVARGAKLMAMGTASSPIIFTSVADEIGPEDVAAGRFESPNLDTDQNGLWGGVIVLGSAPISVRSNATEEQIEGIPDSDTNGRYGGTDAEDNSGTITYVSIRHGGANIGEGNEINGLTLGGVGSGTTINHIEVVANQDDGVEWFGGTVNVNNVLVWNAGDDAIDTDQAWSGTLDNVIVVAGADTDHAFELDGPEGDATGTHTITNGSAYGFITLDDGEETGAGSEMADFRSDLNVVYNNVYFFGFPDPTNDAGRGDFSTDGCNDCTISTLEGTLHPNASIEETFKGLSTAAASSVAEGSNTVGAEKAPFGGWTWADIAGGLDVFK